MEDGRWTVEVGTVAQVSYEHERRWHISDSTEIETHSDAIKAKAEQWAASNHGGIDIALTGMSNRKMGAWIETNQERDGYRFIRYLRHQKNARDAFRADYIRIRFIYYSPFEIPETDSDEN